MPDETPLTPAEEQNERERGDIAREQYIRWRMADLPGVYTRFMPPTADAKTLWLAEQTIRGQVKIDQEHLANPWRQIGPRSVILDLSNLTPQDKITFGLEVSIPAGLRDAPKPGREEELAVEIDAQRKSNPAYAEAMKRLEAARHREQQAAPPAAGAADQGAGDDAPRRREKLL